jgi:hypothetical protein
VLAERAFVLIGAGLVAGLIGLCGVYLMLDAFTADVKQGFPRTGALAAMGLVLGPWMIHAGTRRGPVLEVDTVRGPRKLQFGGGLDPAELPDFVERAREAGVEIATPASRA